LVLTELGTTLATRARWDHDVLHTLNQPRVLVAALALLACSCEHGVGSESVCGAQSTALYNGSRDPTPLKLSSAERNAIVALESSTGTPFCTATLISTEWALGAAHCNRDERLVLRVNRRVVGTRRIVPHPELDAMLIELQTAELSGEVQPISPWQLALDRDWIGAPATLAGRGLTEAGDLGELYFAHEAIVDVQPTEIWVNGAGETGACSGDSGGPLLVADDSGQARVAGVLDRGSDTCLGLDVYTRADQLSAWIQQTLQRAGHCE
jgi:hypothetical protein